MNRLLSLLKRIFRLESTNIFIPSINEDFLENECELSNQQRITPNDYLHPATVEYIQGNGAFVVMGLQNQDFAKEALVFCREGVRDPSIEHLRGIDIHVYSNDKPTTQEDGSIDNEALAKTGKSFKWYKNSPDAIADFKSRVEFFGGSISEAVVYSNFLDLKAKIEQILHNYPNNSEAEIQEFRSALLSNLDSSKD